MSMTLEERIKLLEDREEIRDLVATYCFLVDEGRFDELVDRCFTDNASCDFRGAGGGLIPIISRGRTEIRNFFTAIVPGLLSHMAHTVHNHRIKIDGDRAWGDCYFELTAIDRATGEDVVGTGRYIDRYRRVAGSWRFETRSAEIFFIAPAKQGWSKQRFVAALADGSADNPEGEIHGAEGSNWKAPLDPFFAALQTGGTDQDPEDAGSRTAGLVLGKRSGT